MRTGKAPSEASMARMPSEPLILRYRARVAHLQGILEPLESGDPAAREKTQAEIDSLKRQISDLQFLIERTSASNA
jgi:hypothetical protein